MFSQKHSAQYTGRAKKRGTLLHITSPVIDWFPKFFHWPRFYGPWRILGRPI